jgi:hypothetical protein
MVDEELRGLNPRTVSRYKKSLIELGWINKKTGKPNKLDLIYKTLDYGERLKEVKQLNNWKIEIQYQWILVDSYISSDKDFFKMIMIFVCIEKMIKEMNLEQRPVQNEDEEKRFLLSNSLLAQYLNVSKPTANEYKELLNNYDIGITFIENKEDKVKYGKGTDILVYSVNRLI